MQDGMLDWTGFKILILDKHFKSRKVIVHTDIDISMLFRA